MFSFTVAKNVGALTAYIVFTVKSTSQNVSYSYQVPFLVNSPELLVIDFFSATGFQTNGINNTVYFQAWSNPLRTDPMDLTQVTVK